MRILRTNGYTCGGQAGGNLAAAAGQLGKMVEYSNQSQPTDGTPCTYPPSLPLIQAFTEIPRSLHTFTKFKRNTCLKAFSLFPRVSPSSLINVYTFKLVWCRVFNLDLTARPDWADWKVDSPRVFPLPVRTGVSGAGRNTGGP